jgi:hypothetical protein
VLRLLTPRTPSRIKRVIREWSESRAYCSERSGYYSRCEQQKSVLPASAPEVRKKSVLSASAPEVRKKSVLSASAPETGPTSALFVVVFSAARS